MPLRVRPGARDRSRVWLVYMGSCQIESWSTQTQIESKPTPTARARTRIRVQRPRQRPACEQQTHSRQPCLVYIPCGPYHVHDPLNLPLVLETCVDPLSMDRETQRLLGSPRSDVGWRPPPATPLCAHAAWSRSQAAASSALSASRSARGQLGILAYHCLACSASWGMPCLPSEKACPRQ